MIPFVCTGSDDRNWLTLIKHKKLDIKMICLLKKVTLSVCENDWSIWQKSKYVFKYNKEKAIDRVNFITVASKSKKDENVWH